MFTSCEIRLNNSYTLRSTSLCNFSLPKPKTEIYKGSLAYAGVICWNLLPLNIKLSPSSTAFKKSFREWRSSG